MGRDQRPEAEQSRESGRVWLLVVILSVLGLTLLSMATFRGMAAAAAPFSAHSAPARGPAGSST
jgi:hypothetical protein